MRHENNLQTKGSLVNKLPLINNFLDIVLNNTPLLDVRAPIEYEKGAFLNTKNIPIMTNQERHLIGIRYKENGNEEAVKLGEELIDGKPRAERTQAWLEFFKENPNGFLYCFRGGQRSQITQEWLADAGLIVPRLEGGYKAFRNFLMQQSEKITKEQNFVVLGGRTGSGKTILLNKLENSIDLEGLANHRGSSFGRFVTPQPTPINFENNLAYELIKKENRGYKYIVVEDESRNVGANSIPKSIFENYREGAKRVILETDIDTRVEITYDEYVTQALTSYEEHYGAENALDMWFKDVHDSLERIQKRLGLEIYKQMNELFLSAHNNNQPQKHKVWIKLLMQKYYDPMYDYQIAKNPSPIAFKGSESEVLEFLQSLSN